MKPATLSEWLIKVTEDPRIRAWRRSYNGGMSLDVELEFDEGPGEPLDLITFKEQMHGLKIEYFRHATVISFTMDLIP